VSTPGAVVPLPPSIDELDQVAAAAKWCAIHRIEAWVAKCEAELANLVVRGRDLQELIEAHRTVIKRLTGGFATPDEIAEAIALVANIGAPHVEVMKHDVLAGKYRSRQP
jgi:hypothetical protein